MLWIAFWVLGAVVGAGLGLACFYLLERRVRGVWAWASGAHGVAGTVGVSLVLLAAWRQGSGPQGFGGLAAGMLAATLAGGGLVVVSQVRGRRPSGLVVALHATLGIAGYVMLAAAISLAH